MTTVTANSLHTKVAKGELCKVHIHFLDVFKPSIRSMFGIRLVTNPAVVQLALNVGFDALFIDLEHSTLSIKDAGQLCSAAILTGITPFVRVPYQCGDGFVQRVMDGGAMGVVFPHIHCVADAQAAVSISKYPPQGHRSLTSQLPLFGLSPTPITTITSQTNASGSSVILMIETRAAIEDIDSIAAVPGVDVLLVGSNDLSVELEVPGEFKNEVFKYAMGQISQACQKHGVVMGLAGIYDSPDLQSWAVRELGVRLILGQQDSGVIASAGKRVVEALQGL